jgi:alpha-beta hydrolase superfamily lysophospholipase
MRPGSLLALVLFTRALSAEDAPSGPPGVWAGQWIRDSSALAVEMTFSSAGAGYTGSFSSDQLRVVGIPMTHVVYDAPMLRWEIVGDESTTVFAGSLQGDTLSGTFREGGASGTFILTRRAPGKASVVREEDLAIASGTVVLGGTVVVPAGPGPFPGIVFLHGSGPEGRWSSRYLAHQFAGRGIASLIFDKRGVGRSTGDWRTAGFSDLVEDAVAAVEALRARPYVAPARVGIHGHSQGGTIAPSVAAQNPRVAFVIASSAGGVPMAEMETYSLENSLHVDRMEAGERKLAAQFVRALVATAYNGAPRSVLDAAWERVRDRPWAFAPPPAADPYWSFSRRIAAYDPLAFWRRVDVPALLLYGEGDERVPARKSAARIADAYLGARGPRLDVIVFPGADHTFRLRPDATRHFAWPETAAGYPAGMIDWVLETVSRRSAVR